MNTKRIFCISWFLVGSLFACSSSTTSDTKDVSASPGTAQEAELAGVYCDAYASRGCGANAEAERAKCLTNDGLCAARSWRPEAFASFKQCMASAECSLDKNSGACQCAKSDDGCFREAGLALPASASRDKYVRACREKFAECGKGTQSFLDDWCSEGGKSFELFRDTVYDELTACFANACGSGLIGSCLREKFKTLSGC